MDIQIYLKTLFLVSTLYLYCINIVLFLGQVLFDIDVSDCDSGQNSNITFSITGGKRYLCVDNDLLCNKDIRDSLVVNVMNG